MNLLLLLVLACLTAAIYLILCELLHMPTLANTRAVLRLTQAKKSRGIQAVKLGLSAGLAKHIRLSPYQRRTMEATLKYADISLTPEAYYANAIVKALFRLLPSVLCIFTVPVGIAAFVLWAIRGYFNGLQEARDIVSAKRAKIEAEQPRFVSTLSQELEASRDVLALLEGYLPSAGPLFQDELKITVADMKSGSQEQALHHLAGRVGSAMLSQVVRGLLGILMGGDGIIYFRMLAHDFENVNRQMLKKEALKRPDKLKKWSYVMLIAFAAVYIYVIVVQVLLAVKGMWG
jgi:hypothetical protein